MAMCSVLTESTHFDNCFFTVVNSICNIWLACIHAHRKLHQSSAKNTKTSLSLPLFPFVRGEVMPATFSLPHLLVFSTLLCLVSSSSSLPPLLPSSHLSLHNKKWLHMCMHKQCIHKQVVDACMRACVHACMRACVHACMRACVHACMRACVHACMRACVHAYSHTHLHTCTYTHTCTHTHGRTDGRTHAHTHTHTHTHTHRRELLMATSPLLKCGLLLQTWTQYSDADITKACVEIPCVLISASHSLTYLHKHTHTYARTHARTLAHTCT